MHRYEWLTTLIISQTSAATMADALGKQGESALFLLQVEEMFFATVVVFYDSKWMQTVISVLWL